MRKLSIIGLATLLVVILLSIISYERFEGNQGSGSAVGVSLGWADGTLILLVLVAIILSVIKLARR